VIVPISLWREIESQRETAYLLKSEAMKRRLLQARRVRGPRVVERVQARDAAVRHEHGIPAFANCPNSPLSHAGVQ
jgi:hypothetical protein